MASRHRNWCWTLNNPCTEDRVRLSAPDPAGKIKFLKYNEEIGKEGTQHMQGYLEMKHPTSMLRVKELLGNPGVHLEVRRGTQQQAIDYITKEPLPGLGAEWGEKAQRQGQRNDLHTVNDMIKQGSTHREILEQGLGYQAAKYALHARPYFQRKRMWDPTIIWIYGNSGCGKSHLAYEIAGDDPCTASDMAWPGSHYDGERCFLINNFEDHKITCSGLCEILDKWPILIASKGNMHQLVAKLYILTTVKAPEDHYVGSRVAPELMRRLRDYGRVIHLDRHYSERDDTALIDELKQWINERGAGQ